MKTVILTAILLIALCPRFAAGEGKTVTVTSLADLAIAAAGNGQTVTMKPGVYRVIDFVPLQAVNERRSRKQWHWLAFSGSNNVFHFTGATIEFDTALRAALRPPVHTDDFIITGETNTFHGLTITNVGDGTSPGGAALSVRGRGNMLRDCTLHVRGSYPYGYGDLFGKGGNDVIRHQKHSGVHVAGHGTVLFGCKLYMRSFGHGFYVQQDAANVRFENCYVEGVMRSTDEILAETNGPAFKALFKTVAKNRLGENKVLPGYMKSLSEDGFRTYGVHTNLVFTNCTARNMRGGFELRTKTSAHLENCRVIACERGFWISSGARLVHCRGDAQYGPLLFLEGSTASVDLELEPAVSTFNVHALALINGADHSVVLKNSAHGVSSRSLPIMVGYGTPMMGEGMAKIPERKASRVVLRNETAMPVVISPQAADGKIATHGNVVENRGTNMHVTRL